MHTIVANELPLGKTGVRADLALLGRNFIGIEVKSELDTLRRLEKQLLVYRKYFDRTILLVSEKHVAKIAADAYLDIEIWTVSPLGKLARVTNPRPQSSGKTRPYLALVTKRELQKTNAPRKSSSVSDWLTFRKAFEARYEKTSHKFWTNVSKRQIQASDLQILSRTAELKYLEAAHTAKEREKLRAWSGFMNGH